MIERARVRGFRCLRDVEVNFEPLTVLVGPNGSGKSTLLLALETVLGVASSDTERILKGRLAPQLLLNRASGGRISIEADGQNGGTRWSLGLKAESTDNEHWTFDQERKVDGRKAPPSKLGGSAIQGTLYRLDPSELARASYAVAEEPKLAATGYGLASVLDALERDRKSDFESIVDDMRRIVPTIHAIRLKRAIILESETIESPHGEISERTRRIRGEKLIFDVDGASDLDAHAISEGSLLALGILTLARTQPGHLLLEDLDRGLHPRAQETLVTTIRNTMGVVRDLQIIATTHSPYLVEHLKPEEVRLTHLDESGASVWSAISEHPDWDRWKELMSPGEFWSSVGESWIRRSA